MTFLHTHFRICFLVFLLHYNGYCVEIRLAGTNVINKGRVEVLYDGRWGTICDDDWGREDAMVVCRQLGFPPTGAVARRWEFYGGGDGPIWMDDVLCSGTEENIELCKHNGWESHNCLHFEDAGADCTGMRLVGSTGDYSGRVEIHDGEKWGTVCDDEWGDDDATVVCRQLGYEAIGAQAKGGAFFGEGSGDIVLDDVACEGSEASLLDCRSIGWKKHDCEHRQDAGVICVPGEIRLVGSNNDYQGRVEIQVGEVWGTVCDDDWGDDDATVVCRHLGFETIGAKAKGGAFFGEGSGDILLEDVACAGTEASLLDCKSSGWKKHDCEHDEDAGVICVTGEIRLVGSNKDYQGRVEIRVGEKWGTVCDDEWGDDDATVVCRQLGYETIGAKAKGGAFFDEGSGDILLDDVACAGTEASLLDCQSYGWKKHDCEHDEDAGVICDTETIGRTEPTTTTTVPRSTTTKVMTTTTEPTSATTEAATTTKLMTATTETTTATTKLSTTTTEATTTTTEATPATTELITTTMQATTSAYPSAVRTTMAPTTTKTIPPDIDECLNNPCINGECSNTNGGFSCVCAKGWTGELCDKDNNTTSTAEPTATTTVPRSATTEVMTTTTETTGRTTKATTTTEPTSTRTEAATTTKSITTTTEATTTTTEPITTTTEAITTTTETTTTTTELITTTMQSKTTSAYPSTITTTMTPITTKTIPPVSRSTTTKVMATTPDPTTTTTEAATTTIPMATTTEATTATTEPSTTTTEATTTTTEATPATTELITITMQAATTSAYLSTIPTMELTTKTIPPVSRSTTTKVMATTLDPTTTTTEAATTIIPMITTTEATTATTEPSTTTTEATTTTTEATPATTELITTTMQAATASAYLSTIPTMELTTKTLPPDTNTTSTTEPTTTTTVPRSTTTEVTTTTTETATTTTEATITTTKPTSTATEAASTTKPKTTTTEATTATAEPLTITIEATTATTEATSSTTELITTTRQSTTTSAYLSTIIATMAPTTTKTIPPVFSTAESSKGDRTKGDATIMQHDMWKDKWNESNTNVEITLQRSVKLQKFVENSNNLDASNVAKISKTIDDISKVNNLTSKISHIVLSTVSRIMSLNSHENMTTAGHDEAGIAESRLMKSIDTILVNTVLNGTNWTFQTDNLKIEVEDIDVPGDYLLGVRVNHIKSNTTIPKDNFASYDRTEIQTTSFRGNGTQTEETSESLNLPFSVIDGLVRNSSRSEPVRVSTVVFTDTKLFSQSGLMNSSPDKSYKLNSRVIAATILVGKEKVTELKEPVVVVFQQSDREVNGKPVCVYWDAANEIGEWATEGCFYDYLGHGFHRCKCDHLTSFALIMTMSGQTVNTFAMKMITYFGLGISIVCVSFTLLSAILIKKLRKGKFHMTLLNLCVALLGFWLVFLVGIGCTESYYGCIATAVLLHYFIIAAFMWMLVAGYLQYLRLVLLNLAYIYRFTTKAMILSWGLPLILVIITLSLDYKHYKREDDHCWLSHQAFYFAFGIPVGMIVLTNIVFHTIALWKSFNRPKLQSNQKTSKTRKIALRNAIALFVLLGLTWVFGFFTIEDGREVFSYIFAILNAFQGLFIFLIFIVRLDFVTQFWLSICGKKRARRIPTDQKYRTARV